MPNIDFSRNSPMESSGIFRDDADPKVTGGHWVLLAFVIGLAMAGIFFL